MEYLYNVFIYNNYKLTKETSKAIEFQSMNNGDITYLLYNKIITIVLNPTIVDTNSQLKTNSQGLFHSTALTQFPKKMNDGQKPIHYGYSFKFDSEGELKSFLYKLNNI